MAQMPGPVITPPEPERDGPGRISNEIDAWLHGDGATTLGGLIKAFQSKSFAVLFVVLLGVPALPLPTGGATHVFEIVAMLGALQLIMGRDEVWLPGRWLALELAGPRQERFLRGLLKLIRFLERFTRPRLRGLFGHRLSDRVFGLVVLALSAGAFVAPPFTGLDTMPSLGVVVISLAVLLEDAALIVIGLGLGVAGVVLEYVLGRAAFSLL